MLPAGIFYWGFKILLLTLRKKKMYIIDFSFKFNLTFKNRASYI
jgi:hypothetical protein